MTNSKTPGTLQQVLDLKVSPDVAIICICLAGILGALWAMVVSAATNGGLG